MGDIGHIFLKADNINDVFYHIKNISDTKLIIDHEEYKPYKTDNIIPAEFQLLTMKWKIIKQQKRMYVI